MLSLKVNLALAQLANTCRERGLDEEWGVRTTKDSDVLLTSVYSTELSGRMRAQNLELSCLLHASWLRDGQAAFFIPS